MCGLMGCATKVAETDIINCPDVVASGGTGVVFASKTRGSTVTYFCDANKGSPVGFYMSALSACPSGIELDRIVAGLTNLCSRNV